jgi:hypothetical protein
MSTLKLDTIASRDGTESTDVTNVINGSAKAWVNFNGSGTVAIRESFNVSSISDNGTGEYRVNFTNTLSDSNYAVVTNGNRANDQRIGTRQAESTTSQCMIRSSNYTGGTQQDTDSIFVAVFR